MSKSTYLVASLISFLVGIFLGDLFKADFIWQIACVSGALLGVILFWQDLKLRFYLLLVFTLLAGWTYINVWQKNLVKQSFNIKKGDQIITGRIADKPEFRPSQAVYHIKVNGRKIEVLTERYPQYQYGDVLKVSGEIKKANDYLLHKNIIGQVKPIKVEKVASGGNFFIKGIYIVGEKFEQSINRSLTEPYASFACGLLFGSRSNIPDSLKSAFNRTGTTHITAVSGYNVTIIISYIGLLLGLLSRKIKFWGSIITVICFVILTGASASVLRAGILASLVALGHFEGRRINLNILISLVAVIMILFNPFMLKYDLSFQLSFLSFAGLVYISPLITFKKIAPFIPEIFRKSLIETLAAQTLVLPLIVYQFGRLSLISPVVNSLILWLVPLSMGLIFVTGLGSLVSLNIGHLLGYIAWLPLKFIVKTIEYFSGVSWASLEFKWNGWWWLSVCYLVIILLIYKYTKRQKRIQTLYGVETI